MNRLWRLLTARNLPLLIAWLAVLWLLTDPTAKGVTRVYRMTFVVDVTRSMTARDYQLDGAPVDRLSFVKHSLRQLLNALPCQSEIGLGLFTERRVMLLFDPIEVCSGFQELDSALINLDWRMAWAADSRVAKGLHNALTLAEARGQTLVFLSDGQEAPPVNPRYQPDLSIFQGKVPGLIVGVGGLAKVPIPKFDSQFREIGVYRAEDVPQASRFGLPPASAAQQPGYHARNAPFGDQQAVGEEHLTSVREDYLKNLARSAGLGYVRLTTADGFAASLKQQAGLSQARPTERDMRFWGALLAWLALLLSYKPLAGQK
ncbi:MAG: VWA domain-containing protein [Methylococcales bacterium]|nr:VWA domain-containing protein [Methylococcales bacterium]